jgi:hypothetical protein
MLFFLLIRFFLILYNISIYLNIFYLFLEEAEKNKKKKKKEPPFVIPEWAKEIPAVVEKVKKLNIINTIFICILINS